ncbi:MAG: Gfo/Idh/MocA family oxidoreductase [Saprospiraceae bacterium]|nr:Gfo/Idh/MocA family oxidoreductase [Candidatus Opimibacter skivensis]MBL0007314.1 Gfo/Idh/MocA family oxidoreductase [Candidatus Opimibacter skivensis]
MTTFGLIGYGKIGERHVEHIIAHPEAQLHSIFDIKADRLNLFRNKYKGIQTYDSLKGILNDPAIDIITICTPNSTHADIAIAAMKAGKHVLVEKPMAISKVDCEGMIHIALKTGKSLFVVKQNRFNPPVQAVKKLVDEKKLGKILSVSVNCYWNRNEWYYKSSDWKGKKAFDGGTLFTQFSHFIDVIYYLLGDMQILHAQMANVSHKGMIEFEDTGIVSFLLKDSHAPGVLHYTTSAFQKNMEGSITIFAENATIKIGGKYLNTIDYQSTNGFDITDLPAGAASNNYGDYEGSMSNHDKVIDNVIQSLNGKVEIMTNAYDGLKTVEIIENIYQVAVHTGS